ncbi:MAG: alpha/beta fold hydrolase [Aestuariivirga sp.]|nr:alpha/beta fold hydrolase [Aestuariivirga sp.]
MSYCFDGYVLDAGRRELRSGSSLVEVEPQVFDLLFHLIKHQDRVVSSEELFDTVWQGRVVSLSTLTSRINAARRAVGDSGAAQKLIKTIPRKGYRFAGEAKLEHDTPQDAPEATTGLRQEINFCVSADGVRVAYAKVGSGPPLVKAGNWLNHLEYDWDSPVWSHLLKWMASEHQLIRYDARGNGLSDWDADEISFEAFVRDLEAVVDAAGLERFALFGASQGCAVSIAYAARHPERVSKLVLYGGFARGKRLRGDPAVIAQSDAMITLMRTGWGQENPAFRQIYTSLFVPGGTPEQMRWFNDLQRSTTSPENAVRIRLVSDWIDVQSLLPEITMPTLVLHCRDDAVQPFEEGRKMAAGIPGARFVCLEGKNHLVLESDPCWRRFREEIAMFLAA